MISLFLQNALVLVEFCGELQTQKLEIIIMEFIVNTNMESISLKI